MSMAMRIASPSSTSTPGGASTLDRARAPQPRLSEAAASHPGERAADLAAANVLASAQSIGAAARQPAVAPAQGRALNERESGSLEAALSSPGRSLDSAVRSQFEPHFGRSFAEVRVHADAQASASAKAFGAQAYTIGNDIVFGAGRYAPASPRGQSLIAHELAHVAQHDAAAGLIQRKLNISDFEGGDFSVATLQTYLAKVRKRNKIEDNSDSDDKAREIVKKWSKDTDDFVLEPNDKILLIKEMQSGFTGNDDERAILTLLLNSTHADVQEIFGPNGLDPDDLDSDIHGDEEDELRAFYDREFVGGRKAALKGARTLQPEKLRRLKSPYAYADLRAMIDERVGRIDRTVRDRPVEYRQWYGNQLARTDGAEIYEELHKLTSEERERAAADIAAERVRTASQADLLTDQIAISKDKGTSERLTRRQVVLRAEALMLDLSMQPVFRDIAMGAPKSEADFLKTTTSLTATKKAAAREAITPVTKKEAEAQAAADAAVDAAAKAPAPPTPAATDDFQEQLKDDPKNYGQKIKERIPNLINDAYERNAKNRTEKEHSDPNLTHQLSEMDSIANQSKREVDRVFGNFYNPKAFKAFQVDQRDKKGKLIKKGNLHDAWQDEEDRRKANPAYERTSAKFWLFYLIQNDDAIKAINYAHSASPSFGDDSKALNKPAKRIREVGDPFVISESKRLFEVGRGWDAFQRAHEIFIQLFKNPDPLEDRKFLWETFYTLMHEYLHSLKHKDYDDYAGKLGGEHSTEGSTLIEGVDSLFTEITWTNAKPRASTKEVREQVEPDAVKAGEPFDSSLLPTEPEARADTYPNAVKLVNVVGIRNLYAAYFQGKVKLIGK